MDNTTVLYAGLFALWVVVIIVVAVLASRAGRKERGQRQRWAQERGWSYTASDDALARSWYSPSANRGRRVWATQVVRGSWRGRPILAFVHGRRDRVFWDSEAIHHVVAVVLAGSLATVRLHALQEPGRGRQGKEQEEGVRTVPPQDDRIARFWQLQTRDPQLAARLLHPAMVDRLLTAGATQTSFYFSGNVLFVMAPRSIPAEQFDPTLDLLCDLADLIPQGLLAQHER